MMMTLLMFMLVMLASWKASKIYHGPTMTTFRRGFWIGFARELSKGGR